MGKLLDHILLVNCNDVLKHLVSLVLGNRIQLVNAPFVGPPKGGGGVWCYVLCAKINCLLCAM